MMFTYAMDFFKECSSLKKSIVEHFFTSLLNDLLTKDIITLSNLPLTKFMKPQKKLYATSNKQVWVP